MKYNEAFYEFSNSHGGVGPSVVVTEVAGALPKLESAIDVGAGTGAWLAAAQRCGATCIEAIEGEWVRHVDTVIPKDCFQFQDLRNDVPIIRRYDLAMSLEVAEHLPRWRGPGFIDLLCNLSDFVLFSAAVPGQGGHHHVNERWQDYWVKEFSRNGYRWSDAIRTAVWDRQEVPVYYRQNLLFLYRAEREADLRLPVPVTMERASVIHSEIAPDWHPSIRTCAGMFLRAVAKRLTAGRHRFRGGTH